MTLPKRARFLLRQAALLFLALAVLGAILPPGVARAESIIRGEYYDNVDLAGSPALVRDDAAIDFDWGYGSPAPQIPRDGFSVRWTQEVTLATAGTYTFAATSDDGIRVRVGDSLVIDRWRDQSPTTATASIELTAGTHTVVVEYYERGGTALARVSWSLGTAPAGTVVVDDFQPLFTRGYSLTGFHRIRYGHADHLFWVWNDTSVPRYWGRWTPRLPGAGHYEVQVYIPRYGHGTTSARYRIYHNGTRSDKVISQAVYYDQWVSLGTYDFHGRGGEYVLLASNTGEPNATQRVGYDAVRFIGVGGEASATPPAAPPPAGARSPVRQSPGYGMQCFLWYKPEVATRDLQMVKQAGFGWVKQGAAWRDVEPQKGHYTWAQLDDIAKWTAEQGLNVLLRLDYQPAWAGGGYPTNGPPANYADFGDYCYAVASRYRGRFQAYEIWNEPNLAREWGGRPPNPAEYAALLKVAYQRIKQADPNAIVVSAGLTPTGTNDATAMPDDVFLERMYQAMGGSSAGYFDVLGAHAPGYKAPPEASPAQVAADPSLGGQRFFCFRRVEDLRAIMVRHGDAGKQVFITEFGWTSDPIHPEYAWHRVSEQEKADYLVRAYRYAKEHWSPWIGLMSLIYMVDPFWNEQHEQYWWAISDPGWPEFRPRPAYEALKAMPK